MGSQKSIVRLVCIMFIVFMMVSCVSSVKRTPEFAIDYTANDFGTLEINKTSNPFKFTISDPGNGVLEIDSIVLSGADAVDFTLNANVPTSIKSIETFSFEASFSPLTKGDKTAKITINHNAEGSPVTIDLTGKAIDPSLPNFSINPTTNDFGDIIILLSSTPQKFTITNLGNAMLTVSNITLSGPDASEFSLNAVFPTNVASNSSFDFEVTFNPTTTGTKNATVTIAHNGSTSPDTVNLLGEGLTNITTLFEDNFDTMKAWTADYGSLHSGNAEWLYFVSGNDTGGSGDFIGADSNYNSTDYFDNYADSPVINCSAHSSGRIYLEFDGNYVDDSSSANDGAAIEVFDGAGWNLVDVYLTSWNANGEHRKYDVTQYALGNASFKVSFYYTGQNNYWFDVDNVEVYHVP